LSLAQLGYANQVSSARASELRLPAERRYIVVAKRAAAGFAAGAGLDVEALDDLVIAVAQACENAVTLTERVAGPGNGHIRLLFNLADKSLDVDVRGSLSRAELEVAAQRQAVAVARAALEEQAREAEEMSMRLMGLFVDDCRYRVDERTGGLRVRLTKYRVR
jgi:anti-sigma regulatory factor (Ser/Thr protein kinase)